MFNAMVVTLVEHGLTPSAIVARMIYLGAPESLQGAVAAGLNGLGHRVRRHIEGPRNCSTRRCPSPMRMPTTRRSPGRSSRTTRRDARPIPGIGHPIHKPIDPRTPRLFAIARETGFYGPYLKLMMAIAAEGEAPPGKTFPVNATGAIGAMLPAKWALTGRVCRGLGVMACAVGLVGHILEESRRPMAADIWQAVEAEATAHMRAASGSAADKGGA